MNSTERLQQIFKKPVKKVKINKSIIFSNEAVNDLKSIIKAKSFKEKYDIQDRILNEIDLLRLSFENYSYRTEISLSVNDSLKSTSIEMYNWFRENNIYSSEGVNDIINKIQDWFRKAIEKIKMWFVSMIDFIPNFIKKMFLKYYTRGYKMYTESGSKFNIKAKITSKYRLSSNTYDLIKKSTVDYSHDLYDLQNVIKKIKEIRSKMANETDVNKILEIQKELEEIIYKQYAYEDSSKQLELNEDAMISETLEGNLEEFGVTENKTKTLTSVEEILGKNVKNNVQILHPDFVKNLTQYVSLIKKIMLLHKDLSKEFMALLSERIAVSQNPSDMKEFNEMKLEFSQYTQKNAAKLIEILSHNAKNINKRVKAIVKICAIVYNCVKVGAASERIEVDGRIVDFMKSKLSFDQVKKEVKENPNIINKFDQEYQLVFTEKIDNNNYNTYSYHMTNHALIYAHLHDPNEIAAKNTFNTFVEQARKRIDTAITGTDIDNEENKTN